MKKVAWLLCFVFLAGIWSTKPVQAEGMKIGVVDVQQVIRECAAGKDTTRRLKQKQDERTSDLGVRKSEIAALKKSIAALDPVLEKEELDKKKAELNTKTKALKDIEARFGRQIRDINSKQSSSVRNDVLRIIEQVGRKNGFALIVEKNQALFSGGAADITSQVIEEYDLEFQRTR